MKRFLNNIISFGFLILLALAGYGVFCDYFFQRRAYFPNDNKRMWVMKQTNLNLDYAVIGSSRANGAFDIGLLDSLTNLNGINIAANGSGYVDNYLMLYKFLQNNNKIKYLFLQTDNYSFDPEKNFSNAFHVYNFLPFWHEEPFKKAIDHYLDATDRILFAKLPYFRFYKYNKYFSPIQIFSRLKNADAKPGSEPEKHIASSFPEKALNSKILFGKKRTKSFSVSPFDKDYLTNIIKLCRKHNIYVVCFRAPDFYYQESVYVNYKATNEYLKELLAQKEVPYLEPTEEIRSNVSCFEDAGHLNNYGRFLYTSMFFNQLKTHFKNQTNSFSFGPFRKN